MSETCTDHCPARSALGRLRTWALLGCVVAGGLSGCVSDQNTQLTALAVDPTERDCLLRAMYFESNRSSYDGMMAVGTVVMNRKESGRYPNTICGVVGQRNQFAPGALSRKVSPRESAIAAERAADDIMAGKRHPNMEYVMFFHTAGLHFPYTNMHYRLVAGGNAFYERYPRIPKPQDSMIASIATQQPATAGAVGQPAPDAAQQPASTVVPQAPQGATQSQVAAVATSPAVATPPVSATTLAYASAPVQPEPDSPLLRVLAGRANQPQAAAATAPGSQAAAAAQPVAAAEPGANPAAAAETSVPVPR